MDLKFLLASLGMMWLLLGSGCGADSKGTPDAVTSGQCTVDDECPDGTCDEGQCVTLVSHADVAEIPDGMGKDTGEADLYEPPVGDALEPTEDTIAPPQDIVTPPTGEPNILVDPLTHTFTYLPGVDNPQTKTVTIANDGTMSLVIEKIEWVANSSPEFTLMAMPPLPKKLNPYQSTALTVIFKEKSPHGPATLRITSNDPDQGTVDINLYSQSKTGDEPCVQVMPGSLNFGQVVRGDVKTLAFDVVNCSSNLPVTVKNIKRSQFFGMPLTDEFQIDPMPSLPLTLAGNQKKTLFLTYSPGLAGIDNGYFTFEVTDPALQAPKLDVYGVGVPPPLEEIGLHIEMEWNVDNSDVDMHLVKPGGTLFDCDTDCYYANMSPDWGTSGSTLDDPFLDYDDVDGYGPENTNISEPQPGTYKLAMHYYNDAYEGWSGGPTEVTVRIYSYGQLLGTFKEKLQSTDDVWDVANIAWPGATITVLGNLYDAGNQPMCLPW